jgi:3-deoxy-D-manno-octulosonate 8-phosphate phosphatase (KDO 8-P phosphatase)
VLAERARHIRLVVFDVDGVLTDGRLYFGPQGEALKAFHARDGLGILRLRKAGVEVAILSARRSDLVDVRMADLGVRYVLQGADDKLAGLAQLLEATGVPPAQVAYMGDDVNDLPCLEQVGLAACPSDALPALRVRADFVAVERGGEGAARELADLVLEARR